jgi:hypothetical protein
VEFDQLRRRPGKLTTNQGPEQKQASHDAAAMAGNKKKFLAALLAGLSPGCAAAEIEIGRSTAYNWKRDDSEFAAQWAVPTQPAPVFSRLRSS